VDSSAQTFKEMERIGKSLGNIALLALETSKVISSQAEFSIFQKIFYAPIQNKGFLQANLMGIFGDNLLVKDQLTTSEVIGIKMGPFKMITVPGEILPKFGFELQKMIGTNPNIIIGLGNSELGYIIHEKDWKAKRFSYERSMSMGPKITDVVRKIVAKILINLK